jgi:hypothetical protein
MDSPNTPPPPPKRRRWLRRLLKTLVIGIVLIAVAIALFYVLERRAGEQAWKKYQAQAEARGVKLRMDQFIDSAAVPDGENYAAAPIWREILDAKAADPSSSSPFRIPQPESKDSPIAGSEAPLDVDRWCKAMIREGWLSQPTDNPAADVLYALERIEPQLNKVRQASSRPKSKWPGDWSDPFKLPLEHATLLQSVTRVFTLRAKALLALDRPDEALSELQHAIRAARSLKSEPTMISGLVRMAIWSAIFDCAERGIAANKWSDDHLVKLLNETKDLNLLADWVYAMESERAYGNNMSDQLCAEDRKSLSEHLTRLNNLAELSLSPTPLDKRWMLVPRGWIRFNQVEQNRLLDLDLGDIDAAQERVSDRFSRSEREVAGRSSTPMRIYYALSDTCHDTMVFGYKRAFERHSHLQHFRILCAAERYRLKHQCYPETLDALVPEFMESVPHDIMDGKPMRYHRDPDGGCRVWSIGMNRVDDGGVFDPKILPKSKALDWVAKLPGR